MIYKVYSLRVWCPEQLTHVPHSSCTGSARAIRASSLGVGPGPVSFASRLPWPLRNLYRLRLSSSEIAARNSVTAEKSRGILLSSVSKMADLRSLWRVDLYPLTGAGKFDV